MPNANGALALAFSLKGVLFSIAIWGFFNLMTVIFCNSNIALPNKQNKVGANFKGI
jgi:hypothetical protein